MCKTTFLLHFSRLRESELTEVMFDNVMRGMWRGMEVITRPVSPSALRENKKK